MSNHSELKPALYVTHGTSSVRAQTTISGRAVMLVMS
jgi:hypothetical protein